MQCLQMLLKEGAIEGGMILKINRLGVERDAIEECYRTKSCASKKSLREYIHKRIGVSGKVT